MLANKIGANIFFVAALFDPPPAKLRTLISDLSDEYRNRMAIHILDKNHLEHQFNPQKFKEHRLSQYEVKSSININDGIISDVGGCKSWG